MSTVSAKDRSLIIPPQPEPEPEPTIVDCTMSDGTETTCYEIVITGVPADSAVGPFCPRNISSTSAGSGIWLDGSGIVYEANGDFILDLPNIYGDNNWQLYDTTTGMATAFTECSIAMAQRLKDLINVGESVMNHAVITTMPPVRERICSSAALPAKPLRPKVGRAAHHDSQQRLDRDEEQYSTLALLHSFILG